MVFRTSLLVRAGRYRRRMGELRRRWRLSAAGETLPRLLARSSLRRSLREVPLAADVPDPLTLNPPSAKPPPHNQKDPERTMSDFAFTLGWGRGLGGLDSQCGAELPLVCGLKRAPLSQKDPGIRKRASKRRRSSTRRMSGFFCFGGRPFQAALRRIVWAGLRCRRTRHWGVARQVSRCRLLRSGLRLPA